jgi:carbonic anhydrase
MYTLILAVTAILVAAAHGCYDDSHFVRRSQNGSTIHSWGYNSFKGPANWHGIDHSSNYLCATGKMQTPINLDSTISKERGSDYVMTIPSGTVTFENKGHTVEVNHIQNGMLEFHGNTYKLLQFHFHTPSEHHIHDEYFPMEVHFVHKTEGKSCTSISFERN